MSREMQKEFDKNYIDYIDSGIELSKLVRKYKAIDCIDLQTNQDRKELQELANNILDFVLKNY